MWSRKYQNSQYLDIWDPTTTVSIISCEHFQLSKKVHLNLQMDLKELQTIIIVIILNIGEIIISLNLCNKL